MMTSLECVSRAVFSIAFLSVLHNLCLKIKHCLSLPFSTCISLFFFFFSVVMSSETFLFCFALIVFVCIYIKGSANMRFFSSGTISLLRCAFYTRLIILYAYYFNFYSTFPPHQCHVPNTFRVIKRWTVHPLSEPLP